MEEDFWKIENYQNDTLKNEVKKLTQMFYRIHIIYTIGVSVLGFGFIIRPFINGGRHQVPLTCWIPEGIPTSLFVFLYLMECYILYSTAAVVAGFDMLFVAINVRIIIQFKILRYELEHLVAKDENETLKNLNRCVEHHILLIE